MSTPTLVVVAGFSEITSGGFSTFYLSIVDEGITTGPSDTPANTQYRPRILNPEQFYIERNPVVWVWGDTTIQPAGFGTLQLDNYDGMFNALLTGDVRDSIIVLKSVPANAAALLTGSVINSAPTLATFLIDSVSSDNEDIVTVNIKDVLARLDKVLPVAINPPFVASSAANQMIPLTFGSVRNRVPLLVDQANRYFQLHDANIPNVTKATDQAALLDPHANPPQYVPALSGSGLQLQTMPVGKLTVDCASYGVQSSIPGTSDVLAAIGLFNGTWSVGPPTVPPGWTYSDPATYNAGSITKGQVNIFGSGSTAVNLVSGSQWMPGNNGVYLKTNLNVIKMGRAYRLRFSLCTVLGTKSSDLVFEAGVLVCTKLNSSNASDYIAGYMHPLGTAQAYKAQDFIYEFTAPTDADRPLIFMLTIASGAPYAAASMYAQATLYNVTLEELGQYNALPQQGIPFDQYLTEILVNRAGESPSIFNATEAAAVTNREYTYGALQQNTLIPWGVAFDQPPNILNECIRPALDMRCFTTFTDNTGTLRFRRLVDPSKPEGRTVKADFNATNVQRPISLTSDDARNLTTIMGATHNCYVYSASDFNTDQNVVTQDLKIKYMRNSQYWCYAGLTPAGHYASASSAPVFDTLFDDSRDAQVEIDRVVSIYRPQFYSDNTSTSGKRTIVQFTAFYDDPTAVGVTITAAVTDLQFGDIVQFSYPLPIGGQWFNNAYGCIVGWRIYPFSQQIALRILV